MAPSGGALRHLVSIEIRRAAIHVRNLRLKYPEAAPRDLAQHLINDKKKLAQTFGGVSGLFGLLALPADYLAMAWLELSLLVDMATLYQWNLKSERTRAEVLELFEYLEGIGALTRATPKLAVFLAARLFRKGALRVLGRAVPMVAVPLGALINRSHLQKIGDEALRHFEGFEKARLKPKKAANA